MTCPDEAAWTVQRIAPPNKLSRLPIHKHHCLTNVPGGAESWPSDSLAVYGGSRDLGQAKQSAETSQRNGSLQRFSPHLAQSSYIHTWRWLTMFDSGGSKTQSSRAARCIFDM